MPRTDWWPQVGERVIVHAANQVFKGKLRKIPDANGQNYAIVTKDRKVIYFDTYDIMFDMQRDPEE